MDKGSMRMKLSEGCREQLTTATVEKAELKRD